MSTIRSVEEIIASAKGGLDEGSKDIVALQYFDAATNLINSSKHLAPLLPPDQAEKLSRFNSLATNINAMTRSFVTQRSMDRI